MTARLPGNPFDPRHAYTGADTLSGEGEEQWVSEDGMTDATLIALNLKQLTHATMSAAFEQRTANLIALLHQAPYGGGRADLIDTIRTRLGLNDGSTE